MNERNAGRKRKFDAETIKKLVELYHKGHSVSALAKEYGVSRQTMSFYIHDLGTEIEFVSKDGNRMIVRSFSYWKKINRDFALNDKELNDYTLRLDYMLDDKVLTTILADCKNEKILACNYTEYPMKRAFGIIKYPDWADFIWFLEDRCVPHSRDHIKLVLRDLHLDFYDPLLIIRKTGGRMAEDRRFIRITDFEVGHESI